MATDPDSTPTQPVARVGIHLRAATVSIVLDLPAPAPGEPAPLPRVVHWGAPLSPTVDVRSLVHLVDPPTPHSAPDEPLRRPVLPMPADGWRLRPGLQGSRPDGTDWSPRFGLVRLDVEHDRDGSVRMARLSARDEVARLGLEITLCLEPGGVLRMGQTLTNEGDTDYLVSGLSATLPIPARAAEVLDLTGRWCRERAPQRHPLLLGTWSREGRHGRTGHDAPTVLTVGTPGFGFGHGEVWGVHLGWSGDSVVWAERSPVGFAQVGAGELLAPGELRLAPGESYVAPTLYAAYSGEGLDGMSAAYHDYVRGRPVHPSTPRPVLLNTWEAVYFDHRLDRLTTLADAAAAVGVERFVLDDGWFGGRRDDTAGLGDWVVSPQVWPDGLTPLISHVTGLGMEFGLWVEPEMVNPDSDLYRAHPEWVLHIAGRTPPTWRGQHVLDLARPEVFEHLLGRLDALLADNDISFLKWDHNRDLIDAGHDGRPGVHEQTLAVYRLLDELRARHRGVEIESCASGGGRVDLGILDRTDRVWASDTIDAHERQHIQRWTQLLVPPELVGAHIGAGVSHTTGRRHTLAFRAATAIFGHFGIEADLTAVSDADRAGIAQAVATYKRLRHLLHTGRVVRLDHVDPGVLVHGVVSQDRGEALFAYVQLDSSPTEVPAPMRLRDLDDGARYRVRLMPIAGGPTAQETATPPWATRSDGVIATGEVLTRVGIHLPILHPEQAVLLHLERVT